MKDDFTLIQKHIPENRDITIYPIADVHLGAAQIIKLSGGSKEIKIIM